MKNFIDCHAHLDDEAFDQNRQQLIDSLADDDVEFVINCGSDLQTSKNSLELAKNFDNIFCVLGCHPHEAKFFDLDTQNFLSQNATHPKVLAIGEIGLDYHYDLSLREVQRSVFEKQIILANKLGLPIVIHTREAWGDTLDILAKNKSYLNNGVLFHCFNGSAETTKILIDKYDAYFSLGGAITFKNFKGFDTIKQIPITRILTETDCPYMTPVPFRGQTNTPKNVAIVAKRLAEEFDLDTSDFCQTVRQNTLRLFPKLKNFFNF